MVLNLDFKEFIALLNAHEVQYLVVGGYAVAFHGHPRYTKDIDIWVAPEQANAEKLIQVLENFGFGAMNLGPDDFTEPDCVIQLGHPPHRIDLLTSVTGVDFQACYAARAVIEVEGLTISFIDLENLKRNKRATGRHQDLADLENLE